MDVPAKCDEKPTGSGVPFEILAKRGEKLGSSGGPAAERGRNGNYTSPEHDRAGGRGPPALFPIRIPRRAGLRSLSPKLLRRRGLVAR